MEQCVKVIALKVSKLIQITEPGSKTKKIEMSLEEAYRLQVQLREALAEISGPISKPPSTEEWDK